MSDNNSNSMSPAVKKRVRPDVPEFELQATAERIANEALASDGQENAESGWEGGTADEFADFWLEGAAGDDVDGQPLNKRQKEELRGMVSKLIEEGYCPADHDAPTDEDEAEEAEDEAAEDEAAEALVADRHDNAVYELSNSLADDWSGYYVDPQRSDSDGDPTTTVWLSEAEGAFGVRVSSFLDSTEGEATSQFWLVEAGGRTVGSPFGEAGAAAHTAVQHETLRIEKRDADEAEDFGLV